uniref:Immunoglobulin V-set domain-containing protein n=1 Tax=Peromyscus maniculatus bairdii TaxID=230844 RepID=A0A8C8UJ10_PERMB
MCLLLCPSLPCRNIMRSGDKSQSVTQPDAHVTVFEGDSVELRCNYSYSGAPYLFWYKQNHDQGLQLLLRYFSGDPVVHGVNSFEAEFQKSKSSFHLKKTSVHLSDSAVYFSALSAQCLRLQGELNTNL